MGAVLSRLIILVGTIFIVRLLGNEEYGQFAILHSTLNMASVFAGFGLGITATKHVAEFKTREPLRLGRILTLLGRTALVSGFVFAVSLALGSSVIAASVLNAPHLESMIVLLSVAIFFGTLDGYQSGALLGFEAVRESTLGLLLASLLSMPITIGLTMTFGLAGTVGGFVLTSMIQCAISRWILAKTVRHFSIPVVRDNLLLESGLLWKFAFPALLSGAMVAPVHWICHVLVINLPNGKTEMAVLGIASQWYQAILFLPGAAGRIALPVLTDVLAESQASRAVKVLIASVLANSMVAVPVAIIIGLASPWVMGMYGDAYISEWPVLAVAVAAGVVSAICVPVGQTLAAKGHMWMGWLMNIGWAAIYIGVSYSLIEFGALGVAGGMAVAYLCHLGWISIWSWWYLKSSQ